jgi:glycosyltransferase involved in cell wall biosynthesis
VNLRNNSIWSRSGLSTKLSEYLAAGRAVLTTDVGDNARYVEDGKSALVVSPDEPHEKVAAVLRQAIEHADWRRELGQGARQVALSHFDLPVVQQLMAKALAESVHSGVGSA